MSGQGRLPARVRALSLCALLLTLAGGGCTEQRSAEASAAAAAFQGIQSFIERRDAVFTGR
ncbi:hypothetical protein [Streptomyces sp. NPDC001500]